MPQTVEIQQLYIYPVKSLKGISLNESNASFNGLAFDRQWAIVDEDDRVLTQRNFPQMALIEVSEVSEHGLTLTHKSLDDLSIRENELTLHSNITIWKDAVPSLKSDTRFSDWLEKALDLDKPLFIAKVKDADVRQYFDPSRFNIHGQYFSDAAPYLITNTASLEALNASLDRDNASSHPTIDMRHFRPNIVVSGIAPFQEHELSVLTAKSGACLTLVDACQRCSMITVNPDTGQFLEKAYPFKELASMNPMPNAPKAPAFGVNSLLTAPSDKSIVLRVGDTLLAS